MSTSKRNTLLGIYKNLYGYYGAQGWWPGDTRLEVIVGAILTQNTAWANVEKAINNLKLEKVVASPVKFNNIPASKLAALIRPAGYYNVKSKRIKNFIHFLFSRYKGSLSGVSNVPTEQLRKELLDINGIGQETCDSILLYAFRRPVFVVDAYTRRIFSRHGFLNECDSYEKVQKIFTDNLPEDEKVFNEYHALIVRIGKEFCRKKPRCEKCPLSRIKIT